MESADRRIGNRTNLDIVDLPFVGYRIEDLSLFEYNLLDLSSTGIQIDVRMRPGEGVRPLRKDDAVDLLLFLKQDTASDELLFRGRIMWTKAGTPPEAMACGLRLEGSATEREGEGQPQIPCHLSLSLETSNVIFENLSADSAQDLFLDIIEESLLTKEEILRELDNGIHTTGRSRHEANDILGQLRARHGRDIHLLKSYNESARGGFESGCGDGPPLTYEEICALLNIGSACLDSHLKDFFAGEETVLRRFTSLNGRLLADHNALVLLRTGYLAHVYQNIESSY